jgi:hypothetical protein
MSASRNVQLSAGLMLLAAVLSSAASGRDMPRYGVFVYSDLCIEPESGDVAGNRVGLLRYPQGNQIIFEYTEGPLMAPLLADKMTMDSATGALTFDVREDDQTVTFRGTVTDDALVGTISDRPKPIRLPRVRDFGRKQAECR